MLFQKNQRKISSILRTIYKPSLNERDIDHLKDQIIQIIKKILTLMTWFENIITNIK